MLRSARASLSFVLSVAVLAAAAPATDLFVVSSTGDVVSVPHPAGTPNTVLIAAGTAGLTTPVGSVIGPDGYLYVVSNGTDEVLRFEPDGDFDCGFEWPVIPGFTGPSCLVFDPVDGALLVGGYSCGRVVRVNVSNGQWSDEFTAYADGLLTPSGLSFHPLTGHLLVADYLGDVIWDVCFSGSVDLCTFVAAGSTGMGDPTGLDGPFQMVWRNNELYVASTASNQVRRYHASGAYFDAIAPTGTETTPPATMTGLAFGPDGVLYVGDLGNGLVLKYGIAAAVPGSSHLGIFATVASPFDLVFDHRHDAPFPLPRGAVVATYCPDLVFDMSLGFRPDPTKAALIAVDARADGPVARNWLAPKFWNEHATNPADVWNAANLGSVFGLCLDSEGNVYVTSTSAYGLFANGVYPNGPGAVYRIDRTTGAITLWLGTNPVPSVALASTPGTTTLPNTGPGLGDITYDPGYDVFFVSNLEDGRIYTVEDTPGGGVIQRAFDPWGDDELIDGTAGFPARGERVYAVHSVNARVLLWSGWLRDRANPNEPWPSAAPTIWPPLPGGALPNNTVFRSYVTLDPSLLQPVVNPAVIWKVMPWLGAGRNYSNPVTDITDDALEDSLASFPEHYLVAERTFNGDYGSLQDGASAHEARVLQFDHGVGFPASWNLFFVGDEAFSPTIRNCAGGVAYEDDGDVWSTGDALDLRGNPWCHLAYGLERIPSWGNAISPESAQSNIIDLDEFTGYYNKSQTGDVETIDFVFNGWGDLENICSGDAFGSCPCANAGNAGSGCANSVNPAGGSLEGSGVASVSADTVVLAAAGMPNSSALFFQGTNVLGGGAGVAFGDGVRCAGGTVIRLVVTTNVAGTSVYPRPGDPPLSVRGFVAPGDHRTYQVWYRNAGAFCTASTFNLTNALATTWNP